MEKRTGYAILLILGGVMAVFLIALMPAGIFYFFDRHKDYTNDTSVLYRPDVIQIEYEGKACKLKPGMEEYEKIFEEAERCWDSFTMDRYSGLPLRILLAYMDEKPEDTMEVTFHYKGTIEWQRGYTALLANTYTFFPMAEDDDLATRIYVSKDSNYLEEAVVVVFQPTADLIWMLQEAAGMKDGNPYPGREP